MVWRERAFFGVICVLLLTLMLPLNLLAQQEDKPENGQKKDLPLEPTRKVEFSTDEVTWLSLDVSPDGSTVVMELLGDLYTVPIGGGKATRITEGMAFDSQPRYSPDGKWLAFISDRDGADNLWVAKADGTDPRQLSKEKSNALISPAWMPDSQYVLVSKSGRGGMSIWTYHVDGGSGLEVTTSGDEENSNRPGGRGGGGSKMGAVVSPDGRFLYFSQGSGGYNQMSFSYQVYRRDLRTGATDQITQGIGGGFRPLISADGSKLIYGTRHETQTGLRVRDLNSGEDRWIRYPVQRDDMESRGSRDLYPSYAFIPGGREIVTTWDAKMYRVDLATGDSTEIPFEADVSLDLGPLLNFQRRVQTGKVRSRIIFNPRESPDGRQIAFSAMAKIYLMNLSDLRPRRLTQSERDEFKPSWSADGRWITYVTWDDNREGHIWKIRSDGSGQPQRLTNVPAFYTDPVFSPGGDRLVARRGNAWMRVQTPSEFGGIRIKLDLVWLSAEGGNVNLIVPARGLSTPHFTSESDRIFYYSSDGLVSMRYDGTDRREHLKITGRPNPRSPRPPSADDARISPDGRWALAEVGNQLYVTAVPQFGGESTPSVNVFSPSVPAKRITDIGADSFSWADGGKSIAWSVGSTFFKRPLDSVSFEPEKKGGRGGRAGGEAEETESSEEAADQPKKMLEEDESVQSYLVELEFDRPVPQGRVVLQGATVIPMAGDQVLENADILIENNRIKEIGRRLRVPSDARTIDVKGNYIIPGFVDVHAHYEMRTEGVLELHNWSFLSNLAYGVTTGLDVQTSTNDYLAYLDLVQAGMMLGPRAYSTGPGVFSSNDFQSYEAALGVLTKYKKYYDNNNLKSYVVGNRKQRQWVTQAAKKLELTVTTEGALDLKLDLTHVMDGFGGNEHAMPIIPLGNDVVQLFAQAGTHYTPTLLVLYGGPWAENYFYETTEVHDDPKLNRFVPHNEIDRLTKRRPWFRKDEHAFDDVAAEAAKIQRAGGRVGVGGHGQLQGLGYHWEMWALGMGGMTPREVLKAATIDGAHIVGLEQDLGSLEVGKLADLLVLEKNPLEDIHNSNTIRYVMKNGELFDGDTLHKIYPEEKDIPPFWWWDELPAARSREH